MLSIYCGLMSNAWNLHDGKLVAKLVSLRGQHTTNQQLHIEFPENTIEGALNKPLDEIVVEHIKVLYYLSRSRK